MQLIACEVLRIQLYIKELDPDIMYSRYAITIFAQRTYMLQSRFSLSVCVVSDFKIVNDFIKSETECLCAVNVDRFM